MPCLCFKTQGSDSTADPYPSTHCSLGNAAHPAKAPMDKHAVWKGTCHTRYHPAGTTKAKITAAVFASPWHVAGCKLCARPHCHCRVKRGKSWPVLLTPPAVSPNTARFRDGDHEHTLMGPDAATRLLPPPLAAAGALGKTQTASAARTGGLKCETCHPCPLPAHLV